MTLDDLWCENHYSGFIHWPSPRSIVSAQCDELVAYRCLLGKEDKENHPSSLRAGALKEMDIGERWETRAHMKWSRLKNE